MNFYFFLNNNLHTVAPEGISYPFQQPYFLPIPPSPLGFPHHLQHRPPGIFGNYNPLSNSTNILQNSEQGMLRQQADAQSDKAPRQVGIRRKREKNIEKQTVSAKKNSQSNLINHFFIFFTTRECSSREVVRIVGSIGKEKGSNLQTKVSIFYNLMKMINLNRGKKYMNKQILMNFFTEEGLTLNIPETVNKIQKMEIFKLSQLVDMLRISFYFFIRETSLISILTSKRISLLSKQIHLGRRNKIINDFDNKIY